MFFYVVLDASTLSSMWASSLPPSFLDTYQRHLWDIRSYTWSFVFLFFGPFAKVLLWFTSKMAPSI